MGDNVMLYHLDDIQHCNPEFYKVHQSIWWYSEKSKEFIMANQKYDLRSRNFVLSAGNPYIQKVRTNSKFQTCSLIMRIYNLGDIIGIRSLIWIESCGKCHSNQYHCSNWATNILMMCIPYWSSSKWSNRQRTKGQSQQSKIAIMSRFLKRYWRWFIDTFSK
jgi:hypothetical protein